VSQPVAGLHQATTGGSFASHLGYLLNRLDASPR
jgi:hypothetical protein